MFIKQHFEIFAIECKIRSGLTFSRSARGIRPQSARGIRPQTARGIICVADRGAHHCGNALAILLYGCGDMPILQTGE